jgi:Ser/Thr protein kinase RdoA (MazF antagonist)
MESIFKTIAAQYGLRVTFQSEVAGGFLSVNYVVADGTTRYFLKRYRFDTQKRIEEIHSVKRFFSDGGIPVIMPIPDKTGNTFFKYNDYFYALFPFITDRQLELKDLSSVSVVSMGAMLGKIHRLGTDVKIGMEEKFKLLSRENILDKINRIEVAIGQKTETDSFDKKALESIRLKKKLIAATESYELEVLMASDHLIHGDYLLHNVFFGIDGEVSHVFDFEKTEYSPRTYELFRSMFYSFLSDDSIDGVYFATEYLEAYRSVYPITKEELQKGLKLFYLKSIRGVWVESEHYLKKNTRVDELLDSDVARLKYLSKNFGVLIDLLV